MITKTKSYPARDIMYEVHYGSYSHYKGGSDSITYDGPLPQRQQGHNVWKSCTHTTLNAISGGLASFDGKRFSFTYQYRNIPNISTPPSLPQGNWDSDTAFDCVDQLNLNCTDAVMCYSGILQAIPMLGGVFRINRVLGDLAKSMKKGMRNQPFTTVLKTAISGDFINRFVIQPTLDDIRKASDAMNYVLRVIGTAAERSMAPFALQASRTKIISSRQSSLSRDLNSAYQLYGSVTTVSRVVSKAFMRVEAGYNLSAIQPVKLLAARLGLSRPLESAWDLVPFSFVIDYFARTGDFIQALSDEMSRQDALVANVTRIHSLWGSVSRETVCTSEGLSVVPKNGAKAPQSLALGAFVQKSCEYRRFPVGAPWQYLNRLSETDLLKINLTQTRIRTIFELILQGKVLR